MISILHVTPHLGGGVGRVLLTYLDHTFACAHEQQSVVLFDSAKAAAVQGAAQARDTRLPILAAYPTLASWLRARPWGDAPRALVAPDNVRPSLALAALSPAVLSPAGGAASFGALPGEFVLAVGSERGWSDRERGALEAAGFLRASMGARALRTETACVAAVVLALEKIGALG